MKLSGKITNFLIPWNRMVTFCVVWNVHKISKISNLQGLSWFHISTGEHIFKKKCLASFLTIDKKMVISSTAKRSTLSIFSLHLSIKSIRPYKAEMWSSLHTTKPWKAILVSASDIQEARFFYEISPAAAWGQVASAPSIIPGLTRESHMENFDGGNVV